MLRWLMRAFAPKREPHSECECPWCSVWSPTNTFIETSYEDGVSELECPYCRARSFWHLGAPVPILLHGLCILPATRAALDGGRE